MDRIRQAMERARAERAGRAAPAPAPPPGEAPRAAPAPGGGALDPPIAYTRTRSVDLTGRRLAARRLITGLGSDPVTDAYRVLRTRVVQRLRLEGWNAIAVTSPGPGDGKTLTAINLAISLARDVNHTVLLVDFDLKRPSVHRYLGEEGCPGLSDHLFGGAELADVLFNPGVPRLVVLPGNEPIASSSEVLASPRMVDLVAELKGRYPSRIVLFDLPPIGAADDVMAFAPHVDAVLLVIRQGRTRRADLTRAVDLLGPVPLIGTVLNRCAEPASFDY